LTALEILSTTKIADDVAASQHQISLPLGKREMMLMEKVEGTNTEVATA